MELVKDRPLYLADRVWTGIADQTSLGTKSAVERLMVLAVVILAFVEMERLIVSCFVVLPIRRSAINDDVGAKATCHSGACLLT